MDEKITKSVIDQLISEELDNLSEQEINELFGFGSAKRRYAGWKAGRARKKQVKQHEAFKGNLATKLEQLAGMYKKAYASVMGDLAKNPELKKFAEDFEPWTNVDKALTDHVAKLTTASQKILAAPVEVSADTGTPEDEEQPQVNPRQSPNGSEVTSAGDADRERTPTPVIAGQPPGGAVGESKKRIIKKAQKILRENKKFKVVK